MIILLDFTQSWNDAWAAYGEEDQRWLYLLLGATVAGYLGTLGVSGERRRFGGGGGRAGGRAGAGGGAGAAGAGGAAARLRAGR
jgi:hypothetical protein